MINFPRPDDPPPQAQRCACGKPLHYSSPAIQATIQELVDQLGPAVRMHYGQKQYDVQRHFIALHGVRGRDLAALAARGLVQEVL
jgi:hypothetical protein